MPLSALTLLVASVAAQPQDVPPFVKDYVKTSTYYYQAPDPALGPKMLSAILSKENLEHPFFMKNAHVLRIIAALIGDIGAGHPKIVRLYESAFAEAPPAGRRIVIGALMNAGDRKTATQVDAWLADKHYVEVKADLEALKKHLADPKRQHVRDRPARDPDDLDLLWVNFFATGEYAPIARILDVFDKPDAKENEVMKRVARWSLGSNLKQHPKLVEIVKMHAKERPEGSRKVINELTATPEP